MFTAILRNLDAYLTDIEDTIRFATISKKFQLHVVKWLQWTIMDASERDFVDKVLKAKVPRNEVLCGSLFVSAYAGYEQCIAQIVISAVDQICDCCKKYDILPDNWRKQNIYRTGQALATVMQPRQSYPFDYDELARNIGTCHANSMSVKLNSLAFLIYKGSLDSATLVDFLKRICVSLNWDNVAKHKNLVEYFHDIKGSRVRVKAVETYLDDMVTRRNRLAHYPSEASDVTEDTLLEQTRFIRALCHAIGEEVESHTRNTSAEMMRKVKTGRL